MLGAEGVKILSVTGLQHCTQLTHLWYFKYTLLYNNSMTRISTYDTVHLVCPVCPVCALYIWYTIELHFHRYSLPFFVVWE